MERKMVVKKQEFPTYFDFSRDEIVDLMTLTDTPAIEYQKSIRNRLLFELQKIYVERTPNRYSTIYLHDLIGAFLGCSDVIVEE